MFRWSFQEKLRLCGFSTRCEHGEYYWFLVISEVYCELLKLSGYLILQTMANEIFIKMAACRQHGFCCSRKVTSGDVVGCPWPSAYQIWRRYLKYRLSYVHFPFFQNGGRKNDVTARCALSMSTIVPNLVIIAQTAAELLRFSVFQNGGRPPSWILL